MRGQDGRNRGGGGGGGGRGGQGRGGNGGGQGRPGGQGGGQGGGARRGGGGGQPQRPQQQQQGGGVPSFGVADKRKADALAAAARKARETIQKAGRNAEKVMEAAADFHDDWWELGADEAEDAVHDFFVELVERSGADLDAEDAWEEVHLGLYGMECLQDEGLAETVTELMELEDVDEGAAAVGAFVDEIVQGLTENDTARIAGFGTFRVERERGDRNEVLATVLFQPDPILEDRVAALIKGAESDEEENAEGLPHAGVVEGILDAFGNEWAVDLEGLGTFAAQREEDGSNLDIVFKAAVDLKDELSATRVIGAE